MHTYITPCTVTDAEALQQIAQQSFCETFAAINTKEDMERYCNTALGLPRLREELATEGSRFYFIYCEDGLAGFIKLNTDDAQTEKKGGTALEIERIYILEKYQGKKLGQLLIDYAVNQALEMKKEFVWLGVWEHNQKALAFYEKNGFYQIGAHTFMLGNDAQTDLLQRKDLT